LLSFAGVPVALLACPRCHRQYDVGAQEPGAKVRCLCGNVCVVARPRARQVEMLHCSNCGGRLAAGKLRCEYCSAEVKLADRGLGPSCPECFATTVAGAKHCGACGVRLDPEGVLRALSSRACPRCKTALSECETRSARYVECTGCAGLWLDEALFQRIAENNEAGLAPGLVKGSPPVLSAASLEPVVRYLPCPVCGEMMNRRNFADVSGVILDWCRGHGWWFDAHELERVIAFLEQGGLERARAVQHERRLAELRREKERVGRLPAPLPVPARRGRTLVDQLVDVLLDYW
jgi:Zn-finger nucleic acid-binding protein